MTAKHTMNCNFPCLACNNIFGCCMPSRMERGDPITLPFFWEQLAEWQQATFGLDSERGPVGPLRHLRKEVEEAIANPGDLMEYTDIIFLSYEACRRAGFTMEHLTAALWRKLALNKARAWEKPSAPDQPVEHIRSENQE